MSLLWIETALLIYAENSQSQGLHQIQDHEKSYRSREDRAGDRNRSVRIYRSIGERSARAVTATRKLEVLAYVSHGGFVEQTVRTTDKTWKC